MRIDFTDGWSLSVRAYDEGVAWRFETAFEDSTVIKDELAQFLFHGNPRAWVPYSKGKDLLANAYQSEYTSEQVSDFGSGSSLALLPLLVKMEDETNILICESNLRSYPGMFLEGIVGGYSAKFAHMPDSSTLDLHLRITDKIERINLRSRERMQEVNHNRIRINTVSFS